MTEKENERAHFVQEHFGRDLSDPARYDLVLNTATLGVRATAHLIQVALQKKMAPSNLPDEF